MIKPGAYGPITIDQESNDAGAGGPDRGAPEPPVRPPGRHPTRTTPDDDPRRGGAATEDSASAARRPTWSELAGARADVPLDESLRRASNARRRGRCIR